MEVTVVLGVLIPSTMSQMVIIWYPNSIHPFEQSDKVDKKRWGICKINRQAVKVWGKRPKFQSLISMQSLSNLMAQMCEHFLSRLQD